MKIRNYNRVENRQSRSETDKNISSSRIMSLCGNQTVIAGKLAVVAHIKKDGGIWVCTSKSWKGEGVSSWWDNAKNTGKKAHVFSCCCCC